MHAVARPLAVVAASLALTLGGLSTAYAGAPTSEGPCAAQEAKVVKAGDALARVTAVLEGKKDRVADAQKALAAATTDKQVAKAEKRLAKAVAKAAEAKKEKKAQKQRLAKALDRLAECQNDNEVVNT